METDQNILMIFMLLSQDYYLWQKFFVFVFKGGQGEEQYGINTLSTVKESNKFISW